MADGQVPAKGERKDFFISYTGKDSQWAQWIAFQLEAAGYTTVIQAWDIRPGSNFVAEMDEAAKHALRTIAVLSPAYLESDYAFAEWAAAFRHDPKGKQGKVLPVRIEQCTIEGLLGPIGCIDLVDLDEQRAREKLLAEVKRKRAKPATVPFPTSTSPSGPLVDRPVFPGSLPPVWNIPYPQNSLFIGREELLTQLATTLHAGQPTALSQPQAISGLGGIGKTQIAVEYAYRHRDEYGAILWINASSNTLHADYVKLAALLNLPEKDAQDQTITITAIKHWLASHENWLLILDNMDDLTLMEDYLPLDGKGHILLTTQAQAPGTLANSIKVEKMDKEEGELLLLRRAKLLLPNARLDQATQQDRTTAETIVVMLDMLPLALDQAGAYIEETGCSFADYTDLYSLGRKELLGRRGLLASEHPHSVATTFALTFEKVKQINSAAADLLRLCAFLAPDAIPEEIFSAGTKKLKDIPRPVTTSPLKLNEALEVVRRYSLVQRHSETKTLSIHGLYQTVLIGTLDEQTQRGWAERTVRVVNLAFPDVTDITLWKQCERLLPHAYTCAKLIKDWKFTFPEARRLLYETGRYLFKRAQYERAESFYNQDLAISKLVPGTGYPKTARTLHALAWLCRTQRWYVKAEKLLPDAQKIRKQVLVDTASTLHDLAWFFKDQDRYKDAEPLYQQALEIRKQVLGLEHEETANSLHDLAWFYQDQGRYEQVESFFKEALKIRERAPGPQRAKVADTVHALAWFYHKIQGRYKDAEPLYQQALAIRKRALGLEHEETANSLHDLAWFYQDQGRYQDAEPLYQQALAIRKQVLGPQHPQAADSLHALAWLYQLQGRYKDAEPLYQQALKIREQARGTQHPQAADSLHALASLYQIQGRDEKVKPLYQQALAIRKRVFAVPGNEHTDTASTLQALARFYQIQGRYKDAEPLYQQALKIRERVLGPEHPQAADSLHALAWFYQLQRKYQDAEPLYQQALVIRERVLGPEHPLTAETLHAMGQLCKDQDQNKEAESLFTKALRIREQVLEPEHPDTAQSLNDLALLYDNQGKYEQAEPLYQRALAIREKTLGPDHPDTATSLNNLASLYRAQGKDAQAEPLYQRALAICEQQLGAQHPDTAGSLNNLAELYRAQGKYEQAEPLYQRALTICEQQLGALHPHTALSVWVLAVLSEQQQQYEKAASLYQRALAIDEHALGPQHPTTQTIRANSARLLRTMGHDAEAATLEQP